MILPTIRTLRIRASRAPEGQGAVVAVTDGDTDAPVFARTTALGPRTDTPEAWHAWARRNIRLRGRRRILWSTAAWTVAGDEHVAVVVIA